MKIPIASLNLDFQPVECLLDETVQRYVAAIRSGERLSPIEIYFDGHTYWLFDGFHRVEAARIVGASTLEANITQGTREDMEAGWNEALEQIRSDLRST